MSHPMSRSQDQGSGIAQDRFRTAGTILIFLGVMVWAVYAVLRWGFGHDLSTERFIVFHLCGVVPGSVLRHRGRVVRWLDRRR